jgi:hypothetical protein
MEFPMRTAVIAAIIVTAVVAGFLGYTKPAHQLLHKAGFAAACGSDSGCD